MWRGHGLKMSPELAMLGNLAMLLFLAAAGGGFWMAWTILASDVKVKH